uniref:Uncharacterized protein n=1 Tax=Caenorhabditis japonica TaxID=281687 RepID=A0A8R1E0T8_CAEJA
MRSGTNPHCARIRNRPNTKCPNRKCYESELVLIVTARINNARISNDPYHFGFVPLLTRAFLIWAPRIRTTSNSGGFGFGRSADSYHFGFGRFGFGAAPLGI